jgi:hypothetical protein
MFAQRARGVIAGVHTTEMAMRTMNIVGAAVVLIGSSVASSMPPAAAAGGGRLTSAGSVTLSALSGSSGVGGPTGAELPKGTRVESAPSAGTVYAGKKVEAARLTTAGKEMRLTFQGLNHWDNRTANGGNQFSTEPPDQGLCVGPDHVVDAVNTSMRVFTKDGNPASPTISFNEFFAYPPTVDRTTGVLGPFITDPVCHFDPDTGRFFLVVLTLDQDAVTGDFTGKNRLDIAVSDSTDPTASWHRYKLAVQNDGTEGTPDHGCDAAVGAPATVTNPAACIGDYPHIGADANGIFVSTNEYSFQGDGSGGGALYTGAQIYAFSKRQLAAGVASPTLVAFESPVLGPFGSFTVWPAISPAGGASRSNGGTEYFLSSTLGDGSETGNFAATEKRIGVWAVTNTSSLDSAQPKLKLQNVLINADTYALPPPAVQNGDSAAPLEDCLNDRSDMFGDNLGCWWMFFDAPPAAEEETSTLDSLDTRMQQVVYDHGVIWGAMGTAVIVGGAPQAGILWMGVTPKWSGGRLSAKTTKSGYVGLRGNDVLFPALAVTSHGKVVMAATVTGEDHHPSAAYVVLSGSKPTVKIISEGVGPQDGFSGYAAFGSSQSRFGDYAAAAMDGDTVWLASESIEQTCSLDEFLLDDLNSCGGTRTTLANWATRITALEF